MLTEVLDKASAAYGMDGSTLRLFNIIGVQLQDRYCYWSCCEITRKFFQTSVIILVQVCTQNIGAVGTCALMLVARGTGPVILCTCCMLVFEKRCSIVMHIIA
jgi:hypothetical protein